ncbi:MFS transporter [Sphaerisporangium sp. B11E5]|uniref:MFS transporter n=1 Tax=Sphaerisporangium sp. B11E5 TaxID=3153563 RepID=UPI00325C635D
MRKTMVPLLVTVLMVFSAYQLLTPILAPLSRELSLSESRLGIVITVGAATLTLTSPLWGHVLAVVGLRTVLVTGLVLTTAGLAGFAAVARAGLDGALSPAATFWLMILTRGVTFGAGIAAMPVASVAAASVITGGETERTRAIGLVSAAQSSSLILGTAGGGALAVVSLLLPVYLAPVVTALLVVWVLIAVRPVPAPRDRGPRTAGPRPWEARLWPLLTTGFFLYLSLALIQVIIGFLVADRLGLDPQGTAGAVGIALFVAGVVIVAVQGAAVPALGWPPLRLLRVGIPVTGASFAVLLTAAHLWTVTAAFVLMTLGLGLAVPGFTAATTLAVGPAQQGAVSGLIGATVGTTFIAGPLLGTALYEVSPEIPILASLAAVLVALGLVWLSPAARPLVPAPQDAKS